MSDEDLKAEFDRVALAQNQANATSELTRRKALRKARRKRNKQETSDHMHDGTTAVEACDLCGPILEEIK
jgi:hypothetical protein